MTRVAVLLLVLVSVAASVAQGNDASVEMLVERVGELRIQADYAGALEAALELAALRKGDADSRPYQIADAERLVGTMELVAGFSPEDRLEMARADSLSSVIDACLAESRNDDGFSAAERQLDVRRRLLGDSHHEVAISLSSLGACKRAQGDYGAAESLYRDALAMRRATLGDEHPLVAATLNNIAQLMYHQADYEGAEQLYREVLAKRRRLFGERSGEIAGTLSDLGVLLKDVGDYQGAEDLLREALAIHREQSDDDGREIATVLNGLASVLNAQGDYEEAERFNRESLALFRKIRGDEHPDVAVALNNLAFVLWIKGDYAEAEPCLRRALAMLRDLLGDEHPHVAMTTNNLANLLRDQGDYAAAEPMMREALAKLRGLLGDEHPQIAASLNSLAVTLAARGDYEGAEPFYRESLELRRKLHGDEHQDVATTLNNLASLLRESGDNEEAESLFREVLTIRRTLFGDEHPHVAISLNNLGILLREAGEYAEAESLFREALATRRALLGDEHPDVATTLTNLALTLDSLGDREGAEGLLAEASRVYDVARLRAGSGLERSAFQESPYDLLAAARLALGRHAEAWDAAERASARSLADLLMAADERELSPSEAAREDSLSLLLGRLESELAIYTREAASDTSEEAAERVDRARNALLTVEAEWSSFEQEMSARYPVTEGEPFALERVQSAMSEGTAVIGWLDVKLGSDFYESWCYAIRSSGPVVWEEVGYIPSSADDYLVPSDRVRSLAAGLSSPGASVQVAKHGSHRLWSERIAPLAGALEGADHLIVVPSGAMLGVPVECLVDDEGAYVGESHAVSYAPSATLHTWLSERATDGLKDGGTLLVGDPPFNPLHLAEMLRDEDELMALAEELPGEEAVLLASAEEPPGRDILRSALAGNADALAALPRLRGTRDEVAAIAQVSRVSSELLGDEATEQALAHLADSGALKELGTLHLATHALVDDQRPEKSALVLSQVGLPDPLEAAMAGIRVYDGLVTAEEVLREWDLDADLVTLSACETGLGREVAGEGYVGFARAFLQAGARSLLVSLWKVDDEATALLMRRFYENRWGTYGDPRSGLVGEPMTKAEALREAKQWLRTYTDDYGSRPYEHPFFWSAFVLIGDPT